MSITRITMNRSIRNILFSDPKKLLRCCNFSYNEFTFKQSFIILIIMKELILLSLQRIKYILNLSTGYRQFQAPEILLKDKHTTYQYQKSLVRDINYG